MLTSRLRRDRRRPTSGEPVAPSPLPRTRSLPVRRSALVRTAVWIALAAGPLGLMASCARPDPGVPSQNTPKAAAADKTQASPDPAGYAELVLDLWLRSGSGEGNAAATELHTMAPALQPPAWGEHAPDVERLAAVRSLRQSDTGWSVTLAVLFKAPAAAADQDDAPPADSSLRYFALPLVLKDTGSRPGVAQSFAVTAAPMEVAGPAVLDEVADPYGTTVPDTSLLATTVGEFLTSYLKVEEGAERYLAPGVTLPALVSASFTDVQVDEIRAVERTDGAVGADGTSVRVRVQITATDGGGGQWPLSYALKLTARDGRWEVTALQSGLESTDTKEKEGGSSTVTVTPSTTDTTADAPSSSTGVLTVRPAVRVAGWEVAA
ncbi:MULTISPECIES: conjugal transfer protein [unclassified Streptomyces]|uniref:conjugal transfer protein n=1 Tax=unclassified Streptomyces TaxID=2593676 RepID=UPI0023658C08|nr:MULTISPECIES: conjugal transfer protein [unclassified Streptomyces]MDF3141485.1 conjugal transfer protein [Streptomyces sp. T21Q-yed]WDF45034.1 conjugal transfer protein [Streptomyces sp. T12]